MNGLLSFITNRFKTTCKHPYSKPWFILDYFTVRQQHKEDFTRSMLGADDYWTDHRVLITSNQPRKKFNVDKLKDFVR